MVAGAFMPAPRASPATSTDHALQRLGDRLVADGVDRVVEESLDQQLLRLGARDAARQEVEELRSSSIWPEVAPWPHCTSSAKISSSGLDANSRLVGEQERLRHHLGVGLLRTGRDDDLALEGARRLAVDRRS